MQTPRFRKALEPLIIAAWVLIHIWISWHRSMWEDELMRYEQYRMTLDAALRSLFGEPSPFAPGEIVLGFLSKGLFSGLMPWEAWARLPSVLWGALTLWLALRMRTRYLGLLVFFSVALTSFSTQARPYSALIFGGALAFKLIWDRGPLSPFERALTWFMIFFTHLYGICYLALALAFRRDWKKAGAAILWVAFIMATYVDAHSGTVSAWRSAAFPGVLGTIKQCLGILGNPHKASFVLLPLALAGAYVSSRKQPLRKLELAAYFAATVLAPIAATWVGRYFFMPRQVGGGLFGFLFLACAGCALLIGNGGRLRLAAATALMLAVSVIPWTLTTVLARPPFADQPFHAYKEAVADVLRAGDRDVLLIDATGVPDVYFEQALGRPDTTDNVTREGYRLLRQCWKERLCVWNLNDPHYLYAGPGELLSSPRFAALLKGTEPRFTRVLHNFEVFEPDAPIMVERMW